jgi:hypothetical protein
MSEENYRCARGWSFDELDAADLVDAEVAAPAA